MKENKKIPKVMHSNSLTVSGDEQGGNKFYCKIPYHNCDKQCQWCAMCEIYGE